jgi:hypothetical protein
VDGVTGQLIAVARANCGDILSAMRRKPALFSSVASLFFHPRGLVSGRPSLISFETSCSFSRRTLYHPARALGNVARNWLAESDVILC